MPSRLNLVLSRIRSMSPPLLISLTWVAAFDKRLCGDAPGICRRSFGTSRSCAVLMRNANPPNHASMSSAGSGSSSGSNVARNHRIVRWMPSAKSTVAFHLSSFSALVASSAMAAIHPCGQRCSRAATAGRGPQKSDGVLLRRWSAVRCRCCSCRLSRYGRDLRVQTHPRCRRRRRSRGGRSNRCVHHLHDRRQT